IPRRDGDGIEAGLAIRDEMTIAHDEAGADAANAPVLAFRQARQVVQIQVEGHRLFILRLAPAGRLQRRHAVAIATRALNKFKSISSAVLAPPPTRWRSTSCA